MEAFLVGVIAIIFGGLTVYLTLQRTFRRDWATKLKEIQEASERTIVLQEQKEALQKDLSLEKERNAQLQLDSIQNKEKLASLETTNQFLNVGKNELLAELAKRSQELENSKSERNQLRQDFSALEATNQFLVESKNVVTKEASEKNQELENKLDEIRLEKEVIAEELTALKEQEPIRNTEHGKNVERLNLAYQNLEKERANDLASKAKLEADRLQSLKETWSRHEDEVEQKIKLICQQLSIEYINKEKFPFSGKPDNAVKICGEYIVFDGKSPQGDDLSNFPGYIRTQAEAAKKYTKHEEVKKDIYLVVPSNAIQEIKETFIPLGTHRVHVISIDSLQSILMHLQKIEEYEFAENLSPEDREKIVSVIGKMIHRLKRRVQIDYFLANDTLAILTDAENLPTEILEGAQAVERASKLNPTVQQRAKRIEIVALFKEGEKLAGKVAGQEIHIGPELKAIEAIPLHRQTTDE